MKKFVFLLLLSGCLFAQEKFKLEKLWETTNDLKISESVLLNNKTSEIYVACINGAPTLKNNKGFIAKISLDGKIIKKEWAVGLNAPKGMVIKGGSLFVNDIDRVGEFDLKTGELIKFYPIEGALFLNDMAVDKNGVIYISDSHTSLIHKLDNGKTSVFLEETKNPNGMLIEGDNLYIGTMRESSILVVDLKTKKIVKSIKTDTGVDGLKKVSNTEYLISDWNGKTYIKTEDGKTYNLLDTTEKKVNSADFEFIKGMNLLLIPTFFDNKVAAYKLVKK